jgi:hypothetical protein
MPKLFLPRLGTYVLVCPPADSDETATPLRVYGPIRAYDIRAFVAQAAGRTADQYSLRYDA